MTLELNPLLDSKNAPISQTQDDHIKQFNSLNKIMASIPDYYDAGKNGDDALIASLQKDFTESWWICTSTRINYNTNNNNLEAAITQHYENNRIIPAQSRIKIPDYSNGPRLEEVLNTKEGLEYLQTLFNTQDDAATITQTLEKLNGKTHNKIRVWTPNQNSRIENSPIRVAFLYFNDGDFHVDGDYSPDNVGRSRGVRY